MIRQKAESRKQKAEGRRQFEWWGVMDAGLLFNREMGYELYKPGEIVQAHVMLGEVELWAEFCAERNEYRIGVGAHPKYGEPISFEEFYGIMDFLKEWTGGGIMVPTPLPPSTAASPQMATQFGGSGEVWDVR